MADAILGTRHQAPGRRRIRKGTTSCWECKRRKQRCHFTSHQSRVCLSCQRRGKACRTQEFDDPSYDVGRHEHRSTDVVMSLRSQEDLIETLQENTDLDPVHGDATFHASDSSSRSPDPSMQFFDSALVSSNEVHSGAQPNILSSPCAGGDGTVGGVLYAVLPSQRDIELIIGASYTPAFLQFFTLPYQRLFSGNMQSASELSRTPKPTDHPVLLARTLLYLAHGIQNLHPSTFDLNSLSLGCSTTTAMTRYLHTASRLVTSNEVLIESLEGLECLILEAVFHINVGNLRRAWITFRRAIGLAQLMGLHAGQTSGFAVLDPRSQSLPAMMWYRIVGQDRYLSLVLGLPPGTAEDLSFASQAQMPGDCATGQLERQHYDIMGRMAGRSAMSGRKIDQDFTRNVDLALQKAAQCVDASWWLVPRASHATQSIGMDNERSLEDVGRILVQINHYNLLVTLHLPSVLSSYGTHADDYGPTTCLNSSRELLSRYIRLRCIRVAPFCCRMIDFSAFTACLALLSAHIARHQRVSDRMDSLAHQHLSDRATVEETITLLPEASKVDTDTGLLQQAAAILECLSVIEANAAARSNANLTVESTTSDGSSSCRSVRVKVPFIGPVTISANGISADLSERPSDTTLSDHQDSEGWSHSLDLPLSPSVYFFQEYGTLEGLDVAPPNSVDEVIGPETMPWSLAAQ